MTVTHHHSGSRQSRPPLLFAAGLTSLTFVAEIVGGLYSGSMALLSDAGHVFMDLTALLFALLALTLSARPPSDRRTYGLHRMEVLAALTNGLLVVGLALWIVWESLGRLSSPHSPRLVPMAIIGGFGLLTNLIVAWRLHDFSKKDLNIRGAFLHVASDALASLGVVVGALTIYWTGWSWVDPLVGLGIASVIFLNAGRLLREGMNLVLEGVPRHLRLNEVEDAIRGVPGVVRVEDLHLWGICSHLSSLTAHLTIQPQFLSDPRALLEAINTPLRDKFHITHTTLQLEPETPKSPD
ncbi:MAG: cation transporter [Elusimicrobia bacterium]|jgi:cobalt-zinc-cadmium efflux system protein|nr:cation transporter [Elusimicrobiota bacterium]